MSDNHEIAVRMIEARFEAINRGDPSDGLHAETSMAIEMAYALGAISLEEHRYYVQRRDKIIDLEHKEFMGRFAARMPRPL